jgi:hypothetical protein
MAPAAASHLEQGVLNVLPCCGQGPRSVVPADSGARAPAVPPILPPGPRLQTKAPLRFESPPKTGSLVIADHRQHLTNADDFVSQASTVRSRAYRQYVGAYASVCHALALAPSRSPISAYEGRRRLDAAFFLEPVLFGKIRLGDAGAVNDVPALAGRYRIGGTAKSRP